jgi:hypothetical protein
MNYVRVIRPEEGLQRCSICDHNSEHQTFYKDGRTGELYCGDCRSAISGSLFDFYTGGYDEASNIEAMLRELEERFPALFVGPVCPKADLLCGCTYKTGCKELIDKAATEVTVRA